MKGTILKELSKCLFLLVCLILFGAANVDETYAFGSEGNLTETGQCGENVYWELNRSTCTLTISGTGPMYDYSLSKESPFKSGFGWIENVVINEGVTSVGNSAFEHSASLKSVTIADSVTSIGSFAFEYDPVTEIHFGKNLKSIGTMAFAHCARLETIEFPDNVSELGDMLFYNCSGLKSVKLPEKLKTLNLGVFSGAISVEKITIPKNCKQIEGLINACKMISSGIYELKSYEVAPGNTHFQAVDGVLYNAKLTRLVAYPPAKKSTSYTVNAKTIAIQEYAFANSRFLKTLTLGAKVKRVGKYAFIDASAIQKIKMKGKCPSFTSPQSNGGGDITIYCKKKYLSTYSNLKSYGTSTFGRTVTVKKSK